MTKQELLNSAEEIVNNTFSSFATYDGVKAEAMEIYRRYAAEKGTEIYFTEQTDFIIENAMKYAIKIAMQQTITLLCDSGLLNVDE